MSKKSTYTSEFKREAVKLVQTSDKPLTVIANELGIKANTLYTWMQRAMKNPPVTKKLSANNTPTHRYQELEQENRSLRKELKRAQMERDILKKAAAYFASQEL